jgi:hypothetical protein
MIYHVLTDQLQKAHSGCYTILPKAKISGRNNIDYLFILELTQQDLNKENYPEILSIITHPKTLRLPGQEVVLYLKTLETQTELSEFLDQQGISVYYLTPAMLKNDWTDFVGELKEPVFIKHSDLVAYNNFLESEIKWKQAQELANLLELERSKVFWQEEQLNHFRQFLEINKTEAKKEIAFYKSEVESYKRWYQSMYGHQPKWFTTLGKIFKLF